MNEKLETTFRSLIVSDPTLNGLGLPTKLLGLTSNGKLTECTWTVVDGKPAMTIREIEVLGERTLSDWSAVPVAVTSISGPTIRLLQQTEPSASGSVVPGGEVFTNPATPEQAVEGVSKALSSFVSTVKAVTNPADGGKVIDLGHTAKPVDATKLLGTNAPEVVKKTVNEKTQLTKASETGVDTTGKGVE